MKTYESSAVAFLKEGQILLHKRSADGKSRFGEEWGLLGGRLETMESPSDAIKRELLEELGFKANKIDFYKKYEIKNNQYHLIMHIFTADFPGFEIFKQTEEGDIRNSLRFFNYEKGMTLKTVEPGYKILTDLKESGLIE